MPFFSRSLVTVALLVMAAPFTATAATAAASTVVANQSFELRSNGRPVCWQLGGTGTSRGTLTSVTGGRTGVYAGRVNVISGFLSGNRKLLTSQRDPRCWIPAQSGLSYRLGVYYQATAPLRPVAYYRSATGSWVYWVGGAVLPATRTWRVAQIMTPPLPSGATSISFGTSMASHGSMTLDDGWAFAADADTGDRSTFSSRFDGPDGLITNEYAEWNPNSTDARVSPDWRMTSGSLFSRNGAAYSGKPDDIGPDATSTDGTNSAVFRLRTRRFDFQDTRVTTRLKVDRLTSTDSTPAVAWDGIHIFLRYKSQYQLYYASVARRDGRLVIKKKCLGGSTNGGTYYSLTSAVGGHDIPFGSWRNVMASVRDNSDGTVTLSMQMDGATVTTVDKGVGCAPLRGPGAVGIRGDNAEFQFDDFVVSTLP